MYIMVVAGCSLKWISLIPPLTIGLNQTICMCQSMQAIASSVEPPDPASGSCQRASTCSGVNLILTIPIVGTFYIEVDFEVCQDPPRILVVVKDSTDGVLFDQYFTTSETVDVRVNAFLTLTLNVIIENYDYSMIIQVYASCIVAASNLLDTCAKIIVYIYEHAQQHLCSSRPLVHSFE